MEDALPILGANFPDEMVRLHAVERISQLSDDDLKLYMIEFAQILRYERNHKSPFSELILERALHNPYMVGHEFFWLMKS